MKITIIGAGAMGGALAEGILKSSIIKDTDLCITDISAQALERFKSKGVSTTTHNNEAIKGADIVAVVVKPWITEKVLADIKQQLDYTKQQLIVIAAGVSSKQITTCLYKDSSPHMLPFYLIIPNIAIAVLSSMTFIVPVGATSEQISGIKNIFDSMGGTIITEERLLEAGTTLASCGIAYAMRYIRASVEGGVEIGFKAHDAEKIVEQTVKGAVELLQATQSHPESKIDEVTTPGGVTIKGLNEMEHAGFTSAVIRGIKAGLGK